MKEYEFINLNWLNFINVKIKYKVLWKHIEEPTINLKEIFQRK